MFTKLEEQYNEVMRKRVEGERQIAVLKQSDTGIGNQTERIFTEEQNALLTLLNQRLLDLIQERDTFLINYTIDHPQVIEQQTKIDNVKSAIAQELKSKVATLRHREDALQSQRDHYR